MSPAERIAQNLHCPGCGRHYANADVQLVGVGDGELDLYLRCSSCGLYLQMTVPEEENFVGVVAVAPRTVAEQQQPEDQLARPITVEDVAEFRQFLMGFEGDINRLLGTRGEGR